MRQLLQYRRASHRIYAPVLPIPERNIVEFVGVVGAHEGDGLGELVKVL